MVNFFSDLDISNENITINEGNWSLINSGLFEELTDNIRLLTSTTDRKNFYKDNKAQRLITDVIYKYTGINMFISEGGYFAMMPPDINKNHVLTDLDVRWWFDNKEIKSRGGRIEAEIDIKNMKVGGDFSKIPVMLLVDDRAMWGDGLLELTAAESAAVILHEVGHAFTYFSLSAYVYSINIPMLGTLNKISKVNTTEEFKIILEEWNGHDTTLTKVNVGELSKKKKDVIVTAIVSNQIVDTKSLINQREYDDVNTEYLADKFAIRLGAGKDLSSALDKMMHLYGSRQRSLFIFMVTEISIFLNLVILSIVTVLTLPTIIIPALTILNMIVLAESTSNAGNGTYDTDIGRFNRMRNDLVSMLKDKEIDKVIGKRIRDDIANIDKILTNYKNYKSIIGLLADKIIPSKRRLLSQTEFYKEIEKLSSNDLFIASYDLRNL